MRTIDTTSIYKVVTHLSHDVLPSLKKKRTDILVFFFFFFNTEQIPRILNEAKR